MKSFFNGSSKAFGTRILTAGPRVTSLVMAMSFVAACTPSKFSSTGSSTLSQTVFGNGATGTTTGTGDGTSAPSPASGSAPQATTLPVTYLCSNKESANLGSNVLAAKTLTLEFVSPQSHSVACSETSGVRDSILNQKDIVLSTCAGLADGSYQLNLIDPSANGGKGSEDLFQSSPLVTVSSGGVSLKASGLNNGKVEVVYDYNNQQPSSGSANQGGNDCDRRASPLVIDMTRHHDQFVQLTAPTAGVQFDILGSRSLPTAHAKKQISWIQNPDFMFLVLPNRHGKVNGINELFGDNTRGPDGKFADNGYEALRKYDGKSADGKTVLHAPDNRIDANDPIFSSLRLWSDKNLDGIVQDDELYTLDQQGIAYIDLNYDGRYQETDAYGNQTMYRSVVGLTDGTLNLIFDIWFRYL